MKSGELLAHGGGGRGGRGGRGGSNGLGTVKFDSLNITNQYEEEGSSEFDSDEISVMINRCIQWCSLENQVVRLAYRPHPHLCI